MVIVSIAVAIIIMYLCCTKCRHTCTIFKYCFPFLPISHIVHTTHHMDLFVEVTNVTKGNSLWAHFTVTGCFPSQMLISRQIQNEDVQIERCCCIFKCVRIDWSNIIVTGIPGIVIEMPEVVKVSIFTDNDLTHITDDHFEKKLIAWLLNQIYVVQPPMSLPRYDDTPPTEYEYSWPTMNAGGATPSAPGLPEHLHPHLT